MSDVYLTEQIKQKARQLGFTLVGFTSPGRASSFPIFQSWVNSGKQAEMHYLARPDALTKREDTSLVMPGATTVIVLGLPYYAQKLDEGEWFKDTKIGRVAAYAWGRDYHDVIPPMLMELLDFIKKTTSETVEYKIYTDTGPILEKDLAVKAGLGWIGKNSCLIHPLHGSYFLLSEIFLNLDLVVANEFITDHCGNCHRCIDACPTHCIEPDRTIDAIRCISYQTIENKIEMNEQVGIKADNWIFGCDICQRVCPWNLRFSDVAGASQLSSDSPTKVVNLMSELSISTEVFNQKFKHSPIKRAKRRGYLRNMLNALGNQGTLDDLVTLRIYLEHDEELVRISATRAIARISERKELE